MIDHLEYRLEKARTFAYAETYNSTEYDDIVVHMKKITDHLGAAVAIDAVGAEADGGFLQHLTAAKLKLQGGSPVALNWAIDSVRKGGTVAVIGAYGPMFSAVKFGDAFNKGLTLNMNQCPVKRQWPRLFEHVRIGYLKPSDVVTHRFRSSTSTTRTTSSRPSSTAASNRSSCRTRPEEMAMPYTSARPVSAESSEELRARIPGWGVDLDPADRPSVPRMRFDPSLGGAHWDFPERQPELWPRERSIEHAMLTPVFGTTCRPKGVSGAIRRLSYRRFSEARAAHWLLLLAADRIDANGSHLRSLLTLHPDNPITQTGVRSEFTHAGVSLRSGKTRADVRHHLLDPLVIVAPWVAAAALTGVAVERIKRSSSRP